MAGVESRWRRTERGGVRVLPNLAGAGTMSLLFKKVNLQVLERTAKVGRPHRGGGDL